MTIQEADVLLKRYYEGFTSTEEEKTLHAFLSQKHLPERLEADKEILRYFTSQKKKGKTLTVPLIAWTSVAASVVIGLLVIHFFIPGKFDSYAYIDGKRITDIAQVKEQAVASIQSWNRSDKDSNMDTDELINQQLQLFIK